MAGDYRRSLADCDEVLERNPRHFGALSGCAQNHFRLENYEAAIEWFERALEVNPNLLGVEIYIEGARQQAARKARPQHLGARGERLQHLRDGRGRLARVLEREQVPAGHAQLAKRGPRIAPSRTRRSTSESTPPMKPAGTASARRCRRMSCGIVR
jgi:tetratricopeptide (TPR) repeat protein